MTLGIALLGTGNIAQRAFVPAVQAVDGARLVAVPESRQGSRGASGHHTQLAALLGNTISRRLGLNLVEDAKGRYAGQ